MMSISCSSSKVPLNTVPVRIPGPEEKMTDRKQKSSVLQNSHCSYKAMQDLEVKLNMFFR